MTHHNTNRSIVTMYHIYIAGLARETKPGHTLQTSLDIRMGLAQSRNSDSNRCGGKDDQDEDDVWSQLPPLPKVTPTQ